MSRRASETGAERTSYPCDACVLRRVRCGTDRPCHECQKRGLECTSLRTRKKRGPKGGPRRATGDKVRTYQQDLRSGLKQTRQGSSRGQTDLGPNDPQNEESESRIRGTSSEPKLCDACNSIEKHKRNSVAAYRKFIEIFQHQLYSIWPVIDHQFLISRITSYEDDFESYALAAALCAATISQLRLSEHTASQDNVSSLSFALDAEHFKTRFDYREKCSLPCLLTAFFLHMYYANANKMRTATMLLREAITFAHELELHTLDTLSNLEPDERSLRVRVYWLLYITEMTFCAQHGLPAIMQPINTLPPADDNLQGADLKAFKSLTRLFSCLRGNILMPTMTDKAPDGMELAVTQGRLASSDQDEASNEIQSVDLCTTRNWIRLLTWEYMTRHFTMSSSPEDSAFSLLLPAQIGHDMLSFFSMVDKSSIRAHGYGMELKVFRIADAVLDLMICTPKQATPNAMIVGLGDVLSELQRVIVTVGGSHSEFVRELQPRIAELMVTAGPDSPILQSGEEQEGHNSEAPTRSLSHSDRE